MQHRQGPRRPKASLASLAVLTALTAPLLVSAAPPPPAGVDVSVTITNLRNQDGVVRACMTRDQSRFPRCQDAAQGYRSVIDAGEARVVSFHNVPPGTYAIAVLHDENGNGRADRTLGMMPREGFGFSRDAPVRMGLPSFDAAAIEIGGSPVRQTIRMRYML
ncbi:DUF2141 domain-containing protein [Aurantiacibacter arachoides]|uniref:DUF2141 domain-containing protein n=1 Tax=Aurantiacibacter arachoides TaxID=1850444 RepID=UPI00199D493C|nr:DUF2141 domain-containing protein [Aurantiacibacter arachoides]GGD62410.1 hypothetical protein GCM10011411_23310 [Aurantiacibacter arachoides]